MAHVIPKFKVETHPVLLRDNDISYSNILVVKQEGFLGREVEIGGPLAVQVLILELMQWLAEQELVDATKGIN